MGKATRWLKGLLGMKKESYNSNSGEKKERKKWCFAKPAIDSGESIQIPANIPADDSKWMRSYITDSEKEQSRHAIVVAAATAAAADAAVAAAQAAAVVVRLTSQGKGGLFSGGVEKLAAEKIQNVFRGFLARKALRALKGLVKLQALVRGYLVRKRAAATLHSMQALIRAQAGVRAERARRSMNNDNKHQPEVRSRKSIERFDENRSEFHSKRHPSSYDAFDESPKIVEIDTCGSKSRSRRIIACMSEYEDDHYYHPVPARLSIPDYQHLQEFDWRYVTEDYKFATAQNTPRFSCSGRAYGPVTPTKSVCGDGYFRTFSNCPGYMANTQSFRAKTRSYSAPKQRPELGPKKRISLNEIMASRSSFSGVRMQRLSSPQAQGEFEI